MMKLWGVEISLELFQYCIPTQTRFYCHYKYHGSVTENIGYKSKELNLNLRLMEKTDSYICKYLHKIMVIILDGNSGLRGVARRSGNDLGLELHIIIIIITL